MLATIELKLVSYFLYIFYSLALCDYLFFVLVMIFEVMGVERWDLWLMPLRSENLMFSNCSSMVIGLLLFIFLAFIFQYILLQIYLKYWCFKSSFSLPDSLRFAAHPLHLMKLKFFNILLGLLVFKVVVLDEFGVLLTNILLL